MRMKTNEGLWTFVSNSFNVNKFRQGKDAIDPDSSNERYQDLPLAIGAATRLWATGDFEMINVTDCAPLAVGKMPAIRWLRQRNGRYGCRAVAQAGSLQILVPDFSTMMAGYLGFPVPAKEVQVVDPWTGSGPSRTHIIKEETV